MMTAFVRTIILYFFIMAGMRLMGKRQIGELEPSELVLTMMISDLAAVPMQDFGIPLLFGLVPILTLLALSLLLSQLSLRSIRFRALVCGTPTVLIQNGKLLQDAMRRNRYTVDEAWYSYEGGKNHVKLRFKTHRDEIRESEQQSNLCVYDMLSMMLRARSFDASDYKVGQKIHFPMVDGGKVEEQTLIYRGKKTFKMEESKTKYRCLVFSFVEYEEGKEKEVVTFYITDDLNHLPVRLDMYLRFGSAKAFLTEAKGVRNPQTSIIK